MSKKLTLSRVLPDGIIISDIVVPHQKVAIIRVGEGINDPVPADIRLIQIDSTVPLSTRGLTPDCVMIFALDHYLDAVRTYAQLEALVEASDFAKLWKTLKAQIFTAVPFEARMWPTIRENQVDNFGCGALIIQGALKFTAAMMGRAYDPLRDDPSRFPNLPYRYEKKFFESGDVFDPASVSQPNVKVSLLDDLLNTLDIMAPELIVEAGGAMGGTGPAGAAILRPALAKIGLDVVPVHMIAMAENFMTATNIHHDSLVRVTDIIKLIQPGVFYSGLGENGVFWRFLTDNASILAERFSNVTSFAMRRGVAPVISVMGVPYRADLLTRWLLAQTAMSNLSQDDAVKFILSAVKNGLVTLDVVPNNGSKGITVRVNNPGSIKLRHWQHLMPALAACRRTIGSDRPMMLPASWSEGLFSSKKHGELPVVSVPHVDALMSKTRVSLRDLRSAAGHWALTRTEIALLNQVLELPLDRAFKTIAAGFVTNVREVMESAMTEQCFPIAEAVYETVNKDEATAVFMWTQLEMDSSHTALALLKVFGEVDMSTEKAAAELALATERATRSSRRKSTLVRE